MVEIKTKKKFFLLLIIMLLISNTTFANIYLSKCKTVERKNDTKSLSLIFSFEREKIVINKINNNKVKYKIKIKKINNSKNFEFIEQDDFFKLEFKPGFSYLKKKNPNPKFNLISNELNGININCSAPRLIKTEVIATEFSKNENINNIDEKQVKKILEKLQSGKEIDTSNLNELMSSLQQNNAQTNIDLGQLQGLLQSKSFMGQLTKGDLIEKLSSEEFLKMIVEEFQKLIKK